MIEIEVNGKKIEAREGDTILSAVKRQGINIPTLCHMDDLKPSGACRICAVDVEGFGTLVPSCSYPVSPGMKIKTHSPRAIRARQTIVELLLANHPDDCLYCERNNDCQLRELAAEYGVNQRRYKGDRNRHVLDTSSPSLVRDPEKCILCGKCVRMCEEIQDVAAIDFVGRGSSTNIGCAFDKGMNVSSCINCGQCIMVCPTGALREKSHIELVVEALNDPEKFVVVQHAPAISVTIAEEFGMKPGQDAAGAMTAALRRMGVDRVFDTSFSADLTIMEEASELIDRVTNNGTLPMMTSCSPGWIKYVEQFYPDLLPNLSTCKSPQQMMGAVIKHIYSEIENLDPKKIFSVSIMPCTAKKFEVQRPEMAEDGLPDIDAVLTTREFAKLIKQFGLDLNNLPPEAADMPLGTRSTAGKLFAGSGGVMEAAVRTAHFMITGKELADLKIEPLRGLEGIKEAKVKIGDLEVGVAVASSLANAKTLMDEVKAGRKDIHFIEVMTCPGGCIAGGGQPINTDLDAVKARMQALYNIDSKENIGTSHSNVAIKELYEKFLGKPLGEKSHKLLHTHYGKREVLL
ncbi:MAG: 2Fe-2S iron-sulfur cluster binding domain-containing protein [bacterium]|nr:2Fe-2S iron-sulfur cluster binding domain-containing protein [bacterium]